MPRYRREKETPVDPRKRQCEVMKGRSKTQHRETKKVCNRQPRRPTKIYCTVVCHPDLDAGEVLDGVKGVFPAEGGHFHRHRPLSNHRQRTSHESKSGENEQDEGRGRQMATTKNHPLDLFRTKFIGT